MALRTLRKDLGWLFRTSESGDSTFQFTPRGLDLSKTYDVTFSNSGQTMEIPGYRLLQGADIRVRSKEISVESF